MQRFMSDDFGMIFRGKQAVKYADIFVDRRKPNMKLFLDRNKTLLPRLDVIYSLIRLMTFMGIVWIAFSSNGDIENRNILYLVGGIFAAHLVLFLLASLDRFDIKLAYLSAIAFDLLMVPLLVLWTGGMESSFFLLFYLTVGVAAYVISFPFAVGVTAIVSAMYCWIFLTEFRSELLFDFVVRIGFLWGFFLAITYSSEFLRKSEVRLLKLFDTLNQRTSELEKTQARLEVIYENSRTLASLLDPDGVIKEIMRILGGVLRYETYAIIIKDKEGHHFFRARCIKNQKNFHVKQFPLTSDDLIAKVMETGESVRVSDCRGRTDYSPLSDSTSALMLVPMTSHGHNIGVLMAEGEAIDQFTEREGQLFSIVARSASMALENAELHKRTEELTIIDELTETFNYRYFVQKLQEEKRRALRYTVPLSLIMVDLDWFKKLNDSYGHEVGNIVLKDISGIIKKCIRDVDLFARYGGEEFAVILPQTGVGEAHRIGERIRDQIEKAVIDAGSAGKLRVTVSVGISSFPENGKSQEELVSAADQALYRAKGEGKNLVCVV
jgi:diguanylate cyclase (GGDEF)-like protein